MAKPFRYLGFLPRVESALLVDLKALVLKMMKGMRKKAGPKAKVGFAIGKGTRYVPTGKKKEDMATERQVPLKPEEKVLYQPLRKGKLTQLRRWCRQGRGRQTWLAEKLGYSVSSVIRLANGKRGMPTLETAFLIERFTEGQVPAVSWLDPQRMTIRLNGFTVREAREQVAEAKRMLENAKMQLRTSEEDDDGERQEREEGSIEQGQVDGPGVP